jgi:hypothetical protein
LNNTFSLLRIRSRMVSTTFILLTSAVPFLFGSMHSGLIYVCFLIALHLLFRSYQDSQATGTLYYAFLCIGIASLTDIHILLFTPVVWILCATQLQSLSWSTWAASLLGLLTPYWIVLPWIVYQRNWALVDTYFSAITQATTFKDYAPLPASVIAVICFTAVLVLISLFHFRQKGYEDRIRTRQFFGFFFIIYLLSTLVLMVRPARLDVITPLIFVSASPIIAHLFATTSSKATNILFVASIAVLFLFTLAGLFPAVEHLLFSPFLNLWSGSLTS